MTKAQSMTAIDRFKKQGRVATSWSSNNSVFDFKIDLKRRRCSVLMPVGNCLLQECRNDSRHYIYPFSCRFRVHANIIGLFKDQKLFDVEL